MKRAVIDAKQGVAQSVPDLQAQQKRQRLMCMARDYSPPPPEPRETTGDIAASEWLPDLQEHERRRLMHVAKEKFQVWVDEKERELWSQYKMEAELVSQEEQQEEQLGSLAEGYWVEVELPDEGGKFYYFEHGNAAAQMILVKVKDRRFCPARVVEFKIHKELLLGKVMDKYCDLMGILSPSKLVFMTLDKRKSKTSGASELQVIGPDDSAETKGIDDGDIISVLRANRGCAKST